MDLAEAYEISVSGGPLGRNSALPSVGTALCLVSRVSWVQVPHRAAQGVVLVGVALHLPAFPESCLELPRCAPKY